MLSSVVIVVNICWMTDFLRFSWFLYFASKIENLDLRYLSLEWFVFCQSFVLSISSIQFIFQLWCLSRCYSRLYHATRWENEWVILHVCRKSDSNTDLYKEDAKKRKKRVVNHFGNFHLTCHFIFCANWNFGHCLLEFGVSCKLIKKTARKTLCCYSLWFYFESRLLRTSQHRNVLALARKASD